MSYVTTRAKQLKLPVKDGRQPLVISVTEKDVADALKANSKRCALSRAATRIPGVLHGYFFRTMAYLEYQDQMVRYVLPPSVQKEIVSFDRAKVFAPGIFQLTPPGNLRARCKSRDRRGQKKKPATRAAQPAGKAPSKSLVAATQRALAGKGRAPGVVTATKQPLSAPRKSLVRRTQYVRDFRDNAA